MAATTVSDLKARIDAAWADLVRQLQGMELHLERSDAPGEWTTREVLSHLLFEPGWDPVATLAGFSASAPPLVEIDPGRTHLTEERRRMSLAQLVGALDAQRRAVEDYLASLPEGELTARKARIPLFKRFMNTDEVSLAVFVGAMFGAHWNDHAGQLAKIRKAAGMPEAA